MKSCAAQPSIIAHIRCTDVAAFVIVIVTAHVDMASVFYPLGDTKTAQSHICSAMEYFSVRLIFRADMLRCQHFLRSLPSLMLGSFSTNVGFSMSILKCTGI